MAYCNNIVYSNCIGRVGIGLGNAKPTEILEINGALKSNTYAQSWAYCATFIDRNVDTTRIVAGAAGSQSSCITFHTYNAGAHSCRMVIKNDGKVGIGLDSPSSLLHLSASEPHISIQSTAAHSTSDGPLIQFSGKGPNSVNYNFGKIQAVSSGSNNAGELQFFTNSAGVQSEHLRITSAGNVGINQSIPVAKLHIEGSNYSTSSGGGATDGLIFRGGTDGDGTYTNGLSFSYGAGSSAIAGVQNGADNDSMGMAFFTHPSGTGIDPAQESMRITSDGKVGIGVTDPDYPFHLQDDFEADIKIETNNNGSGNFAGLRMFKSRGTYAAPTSVANGDTVAQILIYPRDASGWNNTARMIAKICGTVTSTDTPTDLVFSTGTTGLSDILFIKSGGNVGIGDPSPNYRLEVKDANTTSTAIQAKNTTGDDAALQIAATSNTYNAHGVGNSEAWLVDETGNALNIGPPSSKNTPIKFVQNGGVIGKWDAGGAFGIGAYGTTSVRSNEFFISGYCSNAQIEGTGISTSSLQLIANSTTEYPVLGLSRSRGTTIGSHTLVVNNDYLGSMVFFASDGSSTFKQAAGISARINNVCPASTIDADQFPTDLIFSINDGGANCGTSAVGRFSHGGNFLVGCDLACGNGMISALEKSGYGVLEARSLTNAGSHGGSGVIVTRAVDCDSTHFAEGCHRAFAHRFYTNAGDCLAACLNSLGGLNVGLCLTTGTLVNAGTCVISPTVCGSTLMKGCVICGYRTGTGIVGGLRLERCDEAGNKTTCFIVSINPDNNCVVMYAACASQSGILCSAQTFRAPVMYTNDCFCTPGCVHASFYCSTGDITAAGDITSSSDCRLKSEIEVIDCAILIVNNLCGRRYVKDNKKSIGVIAQEVEKTLPEVVFTNESEDEYKSVSYGNIVAVLIEAIKDQDKRINELEKLIGK